MSIFLYASGTVLVAVISFMYGKSEGWREGVLEYYNAPESEKFSILLETRE